MSTENLPEISQQATEAFLFSFNLIALIMQNLCFVDN